ncbi:response regulator transcription factor [Agromyces sp. LHK192]|uniref:response regulator transcription factor n=1 Tax=Agromyces sp. LHK192 TaxID=2498704 RepID=UPI000FD88DBB|nr:response regulator transcription factor [Agromyces sp. LHK192]
MTDQQRIAIVIEDEPDIRELLVQVLGQGGFTVHAAGNGLDGVALVERHRPLVTTLDVSMPGIDGFEAAKRIRAISDTYLIMLTARGDEIDTLMGLEAGADDYMLKPFRPRELRARIDAMLRRRARDAAVAPAPNGSPRPEGAADAGTAASPVTTTPDAAAAPAPAPSDERPARPAEARAAGAATADGDPTSTRPRSVPGDDDGWLEHRGIRLQPDMHLVTLDGEELDLTRSEFELLHLLLTSRRRVRSKADLALALRGESYVTSYYVGDADKRAVEVHLANLRRKLGESATQPTWIETVRGVGYRLTADD